MRRRLCSASSAATWRAELVLVDLGPAGAPAALVLGLDHLRDVVELELHLGLQRARGLPVEHVRAGARVEDPEQDHRHQQAWRGHPE